MNKLRSKKGIVVYKEIEYIYEKLVGYFFLLLYKISGKPQT